MSHDPFAFVAVPAANAAVADAMMAVMGFAQPGAQSFNVGLSATGSAPATHRAWWQAVTPEYVALLTAPAAPAIDWTAAGLNSVAVAATWTLKDVRTVDPTDEWDRSAWIAAQIADMGLQMVVAE